MLKDYFLDVLGVFYQCFVGRDSTDVLFLGFFFSFEVFLMKTL